MFGLLVGALNKDSLKTHLTRTTYVSRHALLVRLLPGQIHLLEFVHSGVSLLSEVTVDGVCFIQQVLVGDALHLQGSQGINQLTLCYSTSASKASFLDFF